MKIIHLILLIALIPISGCDDQNLQEKTFKLMFKSDIKQKLGEPNKIETITKNNKHYFGPIEDLWYGMKMGDKIVIWEYETREGVKFLYFINDSTQVNGESFWYKDQQKNPVY